MRYIKAQRLFNSIGILRHTATGVEDNNPIQFFPEKR